MDKISINLIPKENLPDAKVATRRPIFFKLSVALITALIVVLGGSDLFDLIKILISKLSNNRFRLPKPELQALVHSRRR